MDQLCQHVAHSGDLGVRDIGGGERKDFRFRTEGVRLVGVPRRNGRRQGDFTDEASLYQFIDCGLGRLCNAVFDHQTDGARELVATDNERLLGGSFGVTTENKAGLEGPTWATRPNIQQVDVGGDFLQDKCRFHYSVWLIRRSLEVIGIKWFRPRVIGFDQGEIDGLAQVGI